MVEAENITRLMSTQELLAELDVLKLKAIENENASKDSEDSKNSTGDKDEKTNYNTPKPVSQPETDVKIQKIYRNGGSKMGKLGMVLVGAAAIAAGYFGYVEKQENNMLRQRIAGLEAQLDDVRDSTYTPAEMQEVLALRNEFGNQLKDANNYLLGIAKGENNFQRLVKDSKSYLGKLPKREALEESVAREVAGIHGFLNGYSNDYVINLIQDCYSTSEAGLDSECKKKSEMKKSVNGLNEHYFDTFTQLKMNSMEVVDRLEAFKKYAASYPLKERRSMLAKVDKEIAYRNKLMEEMRPYAMIFAENMKAEGILPVHVREN